MKRIFDKFRNLFKRESKNVRYSDLALIDRADTATTSTTTTTVQPKESIQEKQVRQYNQYKKAMRKRGEQPRSYKAWITGKHPLHTAHRGTFNPIKPIAKLHRISKDKVLRIA